MRSSFIYIILFFLVCCDRVGNSVETIQASDKKIINETGKTILTRFDLPDGFERSSADKNSFAYYLRNLPLKPAGTKVKYYNGEIKKELVYDAVIDMGIGNKDLQQCADANMLLRGEYLYSQKEFGKISFTLPNGFEVKYSEWMKGNRVVVKGNKTSWVASAKPSNTYEDFRNYMEFVFNYAGTISLNIEMTHRKSFENISVGDFFIVSGSPGNAVIVTDLAENKSGEKIFMLAQSYIPAQDIHILKNPDDEKRSPWYSNKFAYGNGILVTPQWTFDVDQLRHW